MGFFDRLFGESALTFDYKWMRFVGTGEFTGAHLDNVYMGRGSARLYSMWTPIGDISIDMGPLAVLVGSHRLPGFARVRETYGAMDVDRDRVAGWFTNDPVELVDRFGGRWATTEFRAGDALIFGMYTMHASLTNVSNRYRLTSDTRYQPAAEAVDERWIGEKPKAHYGWNAGPQVPMEEKRKEWGV
jgi:ectoine hydroxylase-related dioxygenase (phytanoyl-CoA dioxygenase family)